MRGTRKEREREKGPYSVHLFCLSLSPPSSPPLHPSLSLSLFPPFLSSTSLSLSQIWNSDPRSKPAPLASSWGCHTTATSGRIAVYCHKPEPWTLVSCHWTGPLTLSLQAESTTIPTEPSSSRPPQSSHLPSGTPLPGSKDRTPKPSAWPCNSSLTGSCYRTP